MIIGDALYLPFKNKSIHRAVSNHCIEHTDDPCKFMIECHRVSDNIHITAPGLIHEMIRELLFESVEYTHKWVYMPGFDRWIRFEDFLTAKPKYTKKQYIWIKIMRTLPRYIRINLFGVFAYLLDEHCKNLNITVVDFEYKTGEI